MVPRGRRPGGDSYRLGGCDLGDVLPQDDPCHPARRRTGLRPHRLSRSTRRRSATRFHALVRAPGTGTCRTRAAARRDNAGHPVHLDFIGSTPTPVTGPTPIRGSGSASYPGYLRVRSSFSGTRRCRRTRGICIRRQLRSSRRSKQCGTPRRPTGWTIPNCLHGLAATSSATTSPVTPGIADRVIPDPHTQQV